jgi:hypothetical protein
MSPIDPDTARGFLEAVIAAFSILGGGMAYFSGFGAAQSLARDEAPELLAHAVNEGIGIGFTYASPFSLAALIITAWS